MKKVIINKSQAKILFLGLISILILAVGYALANTYLAISSLKKLEIAQAEQQAQRAKPIAIFLNTVTFKTIPELNLWYQGIESLKIASTIEQDANQYFLLLNQENQTSQIYLKRITDNLDKMELTFQQLSQNAQKSSFISPKLIDQIKQMETYLSQGQILLHHFQQGDHQLIVLLQNDQELRATGGFIGSYAIINIKDGMVDDIQIQDIYQPDGQFEGFVEAPAGVREYLSSGKGLRLPDANWSPDFPSSCNQILRFLALGQEQQIEGVLAINLSVVQDILNVYGDLYLADYDQVVTAENLAQIARSDRDSFFPGSQQKPQFLSHLTNTLKQKTNYLDLKQKKELISILTKNLQNKNIQLYHTQPQIERIFQDNKMAGELNLTDHLIYLVESNVGINKANKGIQRHVSIEANDYRTIIKVEFDNQNKATDRGVDPHLGYINYQRLILNPSYQLSRISYQGELIENWDENEISNAQGQILKQIGFLITLNEGQTGQLTIELEHPRLTIDQSITIYKQSGLPITPYRFSYQDNTEEFLLEKDIIVDLE